MERPVGEGVRETGGKEVVRKLRGRERENITALLLCVFPPSTTQEEERSS